MSTYNMLELTLNEILYVIKPIKEDWETRIHVIDELREVVNNVESLRGATVEPFGSFLSNLFTRGGDLDISIELSNGSYISSAGRKHKQTLLGDVLKALRRKGGLRRLQFVPNARVPILKIESNYQNISCDISINNLSGQMKSKFLFWISQIDPRFRDMVLLVKEWAKAQDINNPKAGTLNSYSLSLLVVLHFQTCVPAILPPLKELYPGNIADELIGVRVDIERRIEEVCVANIAKFAQGRSHNQCSLAELFITFLAKFSDINVRATDQGICPYTGQWEEISSNMRWLPKTHAIFIEDPFEQPENTARAVSSGQLTRISEAFKSTFLRLVSNNINRNLLVSALVRPQISQFLPGVGNSSSNNARYARTDQSSRRGTNSGLQFQNQFQKTRQANGLNNVNSQRPRQEYREKEAPGVSTLVVHHQSLMTGTGKPIQASQGQNQQVWRPKGSNASVLPEPSYFSEA
ncbi:Protein heso1 [Ancistrocladus abbreviatus]